MMWALPFGLAAVLRLVTSFATFSERAGQLIFPGCEWAVFLSYAVLGFLSWVLGLRVRGAGVW